MEVSMGLLPGYRERIQAWRKKEKEIPEAIKRAEKVELEKGDLPAILLAGFVNFVLPLMLMCGAICLIAYLLFTIL